MLRTFLKNPILRKVAQGVITLVIIPLVIGTPMPSVSYAQERVVAPMPQPGTMVSTTEQFVPTLLKGIMIDPAEPFQLDFIVDTGERSRMEEGAEEEKIRLIKYFMASLTVPEDDLWVNLSPFERQRIIPEKFGFTDMGRDLLAQDYLLKQLTATLMYPEKELGSSFWEKIYQKAQSELGTTDIPVNTFNKVWIIPEEAVIYEQGNTAYIVETRLKVMLEEDYIALDRNLAQRTQAKEVDSAGDENEVNTLASDVIREIILPAIEEEVNYGKNFAALRQIYHSLILASWYKETIKTSLINQLYSDKNKVSGIDIDDKDVKDRIYQQYIAAFEEGVYNYIKEEFDPVTQEVIPRKYFSGGVRFRLGIQDGVMRRTTDTSNITATGDTEVVRVGLLRSNRQDRAILATQTQEINFSEVSKNEVAVIVNEWQQSAAEFGYELYFKGRQWERGGGMTREENQLFVLRAEETNRIIGMATFRRANIPSTDSQLYGQKAYAVDYIEIAPDFRNQGYGKILLSEIIRTSLIDPYWSENRITANPGVLFLNPAEEDVEAYFEGLGFTELDRDTSDDFVFDSPSLLQRQKNFILGERAARSLFQEGQLLKDQPQAIERWNHVAGLYDEQAEDTEPGEQLGLFPKGYRKDNGSDEGNSADFAVLSQTSWERFVPRGIDSSPKWRNNPAYSDFSVSMGSNANARTRIGFLQDLAQSQGVNFPEVFQRGAVLGFGESALELISVRGAFNVQEMHGVEWVGGRVQSAAEDLVRNSMFPNQIALHHADMSDLKGLFGPQTFDFVYAGLISDDNRSAPVSIAREIDRILEPGGFAFVDEQNPDFIEYLEKRGTVTRWPSGSILIYQKEGDRPADAQRVDNLTMEQRRLVRELSSLGVVTPELRDAMGTTAGVGQLLAQSELFKDNPLIKRSAGYRPTDSIGLFGYNELPGLLGRMRTEVGNQFYYKTLAQHSSKVIAYARSLLDDPANAGKKFVALGRGADLIYDALVALTYLDARYESRRNDVTLIDFSSENITDLGTPENIAAYGEMFRRQIGRQLDVLEYDNLVFINEVASERNTTRSLLNAFFDEPFEYTAGVVYDNIDTRQGVRWDGSQDTSAFDWLDTDYQSGRSYQINAYPVIGMGHQYVSNPFERFLNQEVIYSAVLREVTGSTGREDRAVLATVSDSEFDQLQTTLTTVQTVAREMDTYVTSRELREYLDTLEAWNQEALTALQEADTAGVAPDSVASLNERIVALTREVPRAVSTGFRVYESSFIQMYADTAFTFFSQDQGTLKAQNSAYISYDFFDKLKKALFPLMFISDVITDDFGGSPVENLRIAQQQVSRAQFLTGNYFQMLQDALQPENIQVDDFELGQESEAFPQSIYEEFLLPYAQVRAARQTSDDKAVLATPEPVGGIDLTPNNLNIDIRRDPDGVPVPLTPQQIQDVNINGLYPVIINTIPITNVPLLLGVGEKPESPTDISQNAQERLLDPLDSMEKISYLR